MFANRMNLDRTAFWPREEVLPPTAEAGAPFGLVEIASGALDALARHSRDVESRASELVAHYRQAAEDARREAERLEGVVARQRAEIERYRTVLAAMRGWMDDLEGEAFDRR